MDGIRPFSRASKGHNDKTIEQMHLTLTDCLYIASSILPAVGAIRILITKSMRRRFAWLVIFLVFIPLRDLLLAQHSFTEAAYAEMWGFSGIPAGILLALVTFFACKDLILLYKGSERFGRVLTTAGVGVALLLVAAAGAWSTNDIKTVSSARAFENIASGFWVGALFQSAVAVASACVNSLFAGIYWYFPRPLRRMPSNVLWNLFIVWSYSVAAACELLLVNCAPASVTQWITWIIGIMYDLCYIAWLFGLRESGELSERWKTSNGRAVGVEMVAAQGVLGDRGHEVLGQEVVWKSCWKGKMN